METLKHEIKKYRWVMAHDIFKTCNARRLGSPAIGRITPESPMVLASGALQIRKIPGAPTPGYYATMGAKTICELYVGPDLLSDISRSLRV